jgi:hypothetical protein
VLGSQLKLLSVSFVFVKLLGTATRSAPFLLQPALHFLTSGSCSRLHSCTVTCSLQGRVWREGPFPMGFKGPVESKVLNSDYGYSFESVPVAARCLLAVAQVLPHLSASLLQLSTHCVTMFDHVAAMSTPPFDLRCVCAR